MKIGNLLIAAFFCVMALVGCTHTNPDINQNLLQETWMRTVNLNPTIWTRGASRWFFTGEPTGVENYVNYAPNYKAMTMTAVKVPQFTRIHINGCFQVQLVGGQSQNSVVILGPNDAARQVTVRVEGNAILVSQVQNDKKQMANLKSVIVRIGVCNLRHLKVSGNVDIEGRQLMGDRMVIDSTNSGNILLGGRINLAKVNNMGSGTISVLGAYTPCLNVYVQNNGRVNISGRVGIQAINNCSNGNVSIIGADSMSLTVDAYGNSKTSIAGYVNLKHLVARDNACVHIYWVKSNGLHATLRGNARVGLAGTVTHMDLYAADNARFGGKYLHGGEIYVQTLNNAHANISGRRKIFASAVNSSSIYYFGAPSIVSSDRGGQANIIPVWGNSHDLPVPRSMPQFIRTVNTP